ncbi:unnamed protein product, partial [Polarella glacialis]
VCLQPVAPLLQPALSHVIECLHDRSRVLASLAQLCADWAAAVRGSEVDLTSRACGWRKAAVVPAVLAGSAAPGLRRPTPSELLRGFCGRRGRPAHF